MQSEALMFPQLLVWRAPTWLIQPRVWTPVKNFILAKLLVWGDTHFKLFFRWLFLLCWNVWICLGWRRLLHAINLTFPVHIWVMLIYYCYIWSHLENRNTRWLFWRRLLHFLFLDIRRCCSAYRHSILVHSLSISSISKWWAKFCKYLIFCPTSLSG